MADSCSRMIDWATTQGSCGRSGHRIVKGGCNQSSDSCQRDFGGDGSQWCSDLTRAGCCNRVIPPSTKRLDCCLGKRDSFDDCGNLYCPDSQECQSVLAKYCADQTNIDSPACHRFCAKSENKQFCDAPMREYCASPGNETNPLCSCLNSRIPAPACLDRDCISDKAYKTTDQLRQAKVRCPDMCGVFVHCGGGNSCTVDKNVANLHCGHQSTLASFLTAEPWWLVFMLILSMAGFAVIMF